MPAKGARCLTWDKGRMPARGLLGHGPRGRGAAGPRGRGAGRTVPAAGRPPERHGEEHGRKVTAEG